MTTVDFRKEIAKDVANSGFNVHQEYKSLDVPQLREICDENRRPFAVGAINVTGDLNIGSIIRTASLFGAQAVHLFGRRRFDRRGLVGANNYIDIIRPGGLNDDLTIDVDVLKEHLDEHNLFPVFVEQHDDSILLSIDGRYVLEQTIHGMMENFGTQPIVILGNENRGIDSEIINSFNADERVVVEIDQLGVLRSHNVSVAAGIVMHELVTTLGW